MRKLDWQRSDMANDGFSKSLAQEKGLPGHRRLSKLILVFCRLSRLLRIDQTRSSPVYFRGNHTAYKPDLMAESESPWVFVTDESPRSAGVRTSTNKSI